MENTPFQVIESSRLLGGEASRPLGLTCTVAVPAGEELISLAELFQPNLCVPQPSYTSVQISKDSHWEVPGPIVYMNHSCDPSVFIDTTHWKLMALKDLAPGSEITFFYPSTEWKIAEPFQCQCQASQCLGEITGAMDLSESVMRKYQFNQHIRDLLLEHRHLDLSK